MTTITETQTPKRPSALARFFGKQETKPYVHPYLGGALLGVVLFLAFFPDREWPGRFRRAEPLGCVCPRPDRP